jgi:selenium-binding protein 1
MLWKTDPTFYPSRRLAMQVPVEKLAYVAALNANRGSQPDTRVVVDVDRESDKYGQIVGRVDMSNVDGNPRTGNPGTDGAYPKF